MSKIWFVDLAVSPSVEPEMLVFAFEVRISKETLTKIIARDYPAMTICYMAAAD